jgi:hypothetical protein
MQSCLFAFIINTIKAGHPKIEVSNASGFPIKLKVFIPNSIPFEAGLNLLMLHFGFKKPVGIYKWNDN